MGEKRVSEQLELNTHRSRILRYAGLAIPLVLVAYSVYLQFIPNTPHAPLSPLFFCINGAWIVLVLYQLIVPTRKLRDAVIKLVAYHILALLYVLFITGFDMPFVYLWALLFMASAVYMDTLGVRLSLMTLCVAASGSVIIVADDLTRVLQIGLYFISAMIIIYIVNLIVAAQAIDQRELIRSQAEERLQRDRVMTIVNNLADAILSVDKNGTIQLYNAATLNLLDTNAELAGKKLDNVLSVSDGNGKTVRFARQLRTLRSVESCDDLRAVISGETIRLSVICSPIRNTNSAELNLNDGYIVILRDITKQKTLEEERDEFISVVSHELRTPITIAEGSLSNVQLMMTRSGIPRSTLQSGIDLAHDQVVFLAKMVNDLSTLSRAERGVADQPELIDVGAMVHEIYTEYAPEAKEKSLRFDLDLDPQLGSVNESLLYLKELLQNFVTNAIKYTQKGGVVLAVKRSGDNLEFSVKDTGIGISRSDQQHLFQKFWRSEDYRTRETGGTGLGLYVSQKLARKLNTTIEFKSRLNHGSTFSFTIPVAKTAKQTRRS